MIKKLINALILCAASLPTAVLAQTPPLKDLTFSQVGVILNKLVEWVYTVFLIFAVIYVIVAAFKYLTSSGDSEKVREATRALTYAAVAIAVAMLSVAIQFIIKSLLGV